MGSNPAQGIKSFSPDEKCHPGVVRPWSFQTSYIWEAWRPHGLMVSVLDSGASDPGSGPGRAHCGVFLGKAFYSHGASLHPSV